jgi:ribosome-associated protein
LTSKELSEKIADLAFGKKGFDVKIIELIGISSVSDYFVVCSADSDTQVKAIADHVEDELKGYDERVWHKEGYSGLNWVLLDYVDVVFNVFKPESRAYYNLEKLWGDAVIIDVEDPATRKKAAKPKKTKAAAAPKKAAGTAKKAVSATKAKAKTTTVKKSKKADA